MTRRACRAFWLSVKCMQTLGNAETTYSDAKTRVHVGSEGAQSRSSLSKEALGASSVLTHTRWWPPLRVTKGRGGVVPAPERVASIY